PAQPAPVPRPRPAMGGANPMPMPIPRPQPGPMTSAAPMTPVQSASLPPIQRQMPAPAPQMGDLDSGGAGFYRGGGTDVAQVGMPSAAPQQQGGPPPGFRLQMMFDRADAARRLRESGG